MKLKKGCLTWLAVYAVLAVMVGIIVFRRFPHGEIAIPAGLVGGFVAWLGYISILGIGQKIADARMMRRGRRGTPPPDGSKIAAIGSVVPVGPTLTSPFTRTRCVAYKYTITTPTRKIRDTHYSGFALTPSAVQTADRTVRILAVPDFQFDCDRPRARDVAAAAAAYVAATEFRPPAAASDMQLAMAQTASMLQDDDGTFRFDEHGIWDPPDLRKADYEEWVLKPGDQVCVIGKYSAQRGGIVPDHDNPVFAQTRIEKGNPDWFATRTVVTAILYTIWPVIFFGLVAAGLIGVYAFVPLSATEEMRPGLIPSWREVRLERVLEHRLRGRMRAAGMLDSGVAGLPPMALNTAYGRVRTPAGEFDVTRAEAVETPAGTTIGINNDAVVLVLDPKSRPTQLKIAGSAVDLKDADIDILDGINGEMSGRITYVPDHAFAECRIRFRAALPR